MSIPPLPDTISSPLITGAQSPGTNLDDTLPPGNVSTGANGARTGSLFPGCWLINYTPLGVLRTIYDGTLRVEEKEQGMQVSGDLYQRVVNPPLSHASGPVAVGPPNPEDGIPSFKRDRYRSYIRVIEVTTVPGGFNINFDLYRFTRPNSWNKDATGPFTAHMTWADAPSGYPNREAYAEGTVFRTTHGASTVTGNFTMGWVSKHFRKAAVELDCVEACNMPVEDEMGHDWQTVFDGMGWELALHRVSTKYYFVLLTASNYLKDEEGVTEPSGEGWSDAEMHASMLERRGRSDLDAEWRYHILSVKLIDSTPRGIMYDAYGTDSNSVAREGLGIANNWIIPTTGIPNWGEAGGKKFADAKAAFFRTAVHELGHALGLYHNTVDNGFMNTSDSIAFNATPTNPFPRNIKWAFADDDLRRIRHYPDIVIRPGGVPFGSADPADPLIATSDLEVSLEGQLELTVKPLEPEVPLGAPVRVSLQLKNISSNTITVPADIGLGQGFTSGRVENISGSARRFAPIRGCVDARLMTDLEPGDTIYADLVLLRGADGPLFPCNGIATIHVDISWDLGTDADTSFELKAKVTGSATVLITGPMTPEHAAIAHKVLTTPDVHPVLMFGGHHLKEGVKVLQEAANDKILGPYFAAIEARRLARRFMDIQPDEDAARRILRTEGLKLTGSEAKKLEGLLTVEVM